MCDIAEIHSAGTLLTGCVSSCSDTVAVDSVALAEGAAKWADDDCHMVSAFSCRSGETLGCSAALLQLAKLLKLFKRSNYTVERSLWIHKQTTRLRQRRLMQCEIIFSEMVLWNI